MNDGMVELTRVASAARADELCLLLQSLGIAAVHETAVWHNGGPQREWRVLVPAADLARAQRVLAEEPAPSPVEPRPEGRPGFFWVVGLIVANVCAWLALEGTGGSESRANLIRFGAAHGPSILAGAWWRTVTAVYLHIGALHLLGNMVSLAIFGPLALRRFGLGRGYFLYLTSGVAGNWLSLALTPSPGAKAGASGAILGLLGALAGRRLRELRHPTTPSRFKAWHVVAMLIAFYGFVVGTGHADHVAHLGGILGGAALALLLPPPGVLAPAPDRWLGAGLGGLALAVTGVAAVLAVVAGRRG
jgi:membrane associated rhomboid family serine protease